jgi:peptidoglycan/LPS O-acetylase OafA/YrhL
MAKEVPHFTALDSLRGLAALSVVFYHTNWPNWTSSLGYVRNSYLMVDIFFVLSGFVIAYAYGARLQTGEQIRHYAWLRFWRLYPVHLVFLLVFLGIEAIKYVAQQRYGLLADTPAFGVNGPFAFATNLLLLHSFNLHPEVTFNYPSWSISAEFYTYFLFAGVVFLAGRSWRLTVAALIISLFSIAALQGLGGNLEVMTFHWGALRCLSGFFLGVATYSLYLRLNRTTFAERNRALIGAAAIVAMLVCVAASMAKTRGEFDLTIYPVSALVILLIALSASQGPARVLNTKPIVWLGTVSYSLYMVHGAVLWFFETALRAYVRLAHLPVPASGKTALGVPPLLGNLALLAALAITLGLAHLSYTRIEAPFRDWSRRAWKQFRAPPATIASLEGAGDRTS